MTESQREKLAERIVYRFELGMSFSAAVKDVLDWFGKMEEKDTIWITCEAGRRTVALL